MQVDKTNKRLQAEVDDLSVELDHNRGIVSQLEKKQRQFDKALADERLISAKYAEERDLAERTAREKETKAISLSHETDELKDKVSNELCVSGLASSIACLRFKIDELERIRRSQQNELDELISSKDASGKSSPVRARLSWTACRVQLTRRHRKRQNKVDPIATCYQ